LPPVEREGSLPELRRKLAEAREIYTPIHPDLQKLIARVAQVERDEAKVKTAAPTLEAVVPRPSPAPADPGLIETESRLKALSVEIENSKKNLERIQKTIYDLQRRLSVTPVREQQLAEVTRNYENSKGNYQSLLQKKKQSELATNLETRQKGEQFRVLDPASLPKKPDDPTPEQVIFLGWALAFCTGIALAAGRELMDNVIRTELDVQALGDYTILAAVSTVLPRRDRIARRCGRVAEVTLTVLLITTSVVAGIRTYWRI